MCFNSTRDLAARLQKCMEEGTKPSAVEDGGSFLEPERTETGKHAKIHFPDLHVTNKRRINYRKKRGKHRIHRLKSNCFTNKLIAQRPDDR
ncbi:hypothetical protein NDU88_008211 [Pleurodeles waltl]|uniref:Uncharacterized protein n=1 Tax=Pleurodeles waltl TaxID=8319 RepID=A0AAV7P2Z9_PLEWA|nr:hypothetical protein NDU88_008211 [Pleurodeles waltl]